MSDDRQSSGNTRTPHDRWTPDDRGTLDDERPLDNRWKDRWAPDDIQTPDDTGCQMARSANCLASDRVRDL